MVSASPKWGDKSKEQTMKKLTKSQAAAFLTAATTENKDHEADAKSSGAYRAKMLAFFTLGITAETMLAVFTGNKIEAILKKRFAVTRSKLKVADKTAALESAQEIDPDATHESVFGTKERMAPSAASEKSADVRKTASGACKLLKDGGVNRSLAGLMAETVATFKGYPLETALPDIFIKVGDCLRTGAMRNEWDAAKTAAKDAKAKAKAKAKGSKAITKAFKKRMAKVADKVAKDEAKAETSKANRKLATKSQLASAKGKMQKVTK